MKETPKHSDELNNNLKILVVDDSDFLREAIKKFLQDYDCEVLVSVDGVTGIQTIVESKPDLIFLDLLLPTINGIDLIKVIRMFEETKYIPIVVITGSKDTYLINQCHELGVKKVLHKPLTRKDIFNAVEEVTGDNILSRIKLKKLIGEQQKKEEPIALLRRPINDNQMRRELLRFFVKGIPKRKIDILSALEVKNEVMLKNLMHELKGAGSTIGYPRLTLLGDFIERKIQPQMNEDQWREIEIYVLEVLTMLDLIQEESTVSPSGSENELL